MKIKSQKRLGLSSRFFVFLKKIRLNIISIVLIILLSMSSVALGGIYFGVKLKGSENEATFASFYRFFRPSLNIAEHFVKGIFSNPDVLKINIKYIDYQKLSFLVEKSKQVGTISSEFKEDYIDAEIEYDNETYDIGLKLRGTFLEHVRGEKWSFRLKVKGDNTLFGMTKFSLSSPETRNHIHEWLFQKALSLEGLINLRYKFVEVHINGKNLGIYALEEFFDKRLIENNKLREGIIVKPSIKDSNGDLFVYQKKKVSSNENLQSSYEYLSDLITSFNKKNINAKAIFDIEKSAKYFALTSLFGGQHGHIDINFICYFNPITGLLEPIGYDSNVSRKLERYGGLLISKTNLFHDQVFNNDSIIKHLFESKEFYEEYIKQLYRLSDTKYKDNLFLKIENDLNKNLNILYKEYYYFDYFKRDYLQDNRNYIINQLSTNNDINAIILTPNPSEKINISLENLKDVKIEIINISLNGDLFTPKKAMILESTRLKSQKFITLYKTDSNSHSVEDNILTFKVYGLDKVHSIKIDDPISLSSTNKKINYLKEKKGNIELFDFVSLDKDNKKIQIDSGSYTLDKDLIVPSGMKFFINKGVTINLKNRSNIISYSPIYLAGTETRPVYIFSSDSSGQGITIINARKESVIEHLIVEGLNYPNKIEIYQTGSINFYESPVRIVNLQIRNNNSEDALNIFRSNYSISNSKFENIYSDAFDGDFSNGSIINTEFINCGNDAIDVSGSVITIDSIYIKNIGDKGVSVGEKSILTGQNLHIDKSEIGITSKDSSFIDLNNITINNSKIGFTAYQKKPEYGPGEIVVNNYKKNNVQREFLIEKNSSMLVDGNTIETLDIKIEDILYGNMYGKKSN